MRYLRRTLNNLERIILSDSTHVMTIFNHVAIIVETPRIDRGEKPELKVFMQAL